MSPEAKTERLTACTELTYILLGDLLDLLDEPPTAQTSKWLKAVLDTLLDTLPEEYCLKADDGYLSDVVATFPYWHPQVERLEDQNFALIYQLRRLRERLSENRDYAQVSRELRVELIDWIGAFQAHHHEEQNLMQLAANLVIGGSG